MLLSHSKQFLFIHIAKTGGTSIREALSPYRWGHRYAAAQFISNKMSQFCGHKIGSRFPRHSRIIAAKEMLPEEYFNGLFKFSVVRNPWDLTWNLLASCSCFARKTQSPYNLLVQTFPPKLSKTQSYKKCLYNSKRDCHTQ